MHYKRSVEIYSVHPDAYYNLGVAYYNLGEKENALMAYWKATEVNSKLKEPLKELGGIYYNNQQHDSAYYYFKKALTLDPQDEQSLSIVKYLHETLNIKP